MDRSGRILLILISFVGLMDCLDGTIVSVALPTISSEMDISISTASWITVSFFMMMAGLIILFGRIAKNTSVKKVMLTGIGIFTASSFVCGLSDSFTMLLTARVVQGIGASMMSATIPMSCVRFFSPREMGYAFGMVTIGYSIGAALGPAIGGLLISTLSWHWVFLINIPIGALLILSLNHFMPQEERGEKVHVDYKGGLMLFGAIVGLIIFVERIDNLSPASLSVILSVVLLFAFVKHEIAVADPLIDLRIFRNKTFDFSLFTYFLLNIVYMGLLYLLPFYMTIVHGLDSGTTGIFLFIPPLITVLAGVPVGKWSDATGRRWFCVGSGIFTLITTVTLMLMDGFVLPLLLFALVSMGLMWAFCGGPLSSRIIESTDDDSREMGSTLINLSGNLGASFGTVLFATVFSIAAGAGDIPIDGLNAEMFLSGFTITMFLGAILSCIGALSSYIVKE